MPAYFANRVYGDRARVTGLTESVDPVRGVTGWRIELAALRGSGGHYIEHQGSHEMIDASAGGVDQFQWWALGLMHAKLERDLGPSVSWAESLTPRPIVGVYGVVPFFHTREDRTRWAPVADRCRDLAGADDALVRVPALDDHGEAEADGAACRAMANALRASGHSKQ